MTANNEIMNDQVSSILGISDAITPNVPNVIPAPLPPVVQQFRTRTPVAVRTDGQTQVDNDAEYARDNLYDVISKVNESVDNLMVIAQQAQSARHYEVLNQLLITQRDTATQLLKLQSDRVKMNANVKPTSSGSSNTNVQINNPVFVGTSAQLLDILSGNKTQEEVQDEIPDAEFLVDDE